MPSEPRSTRERRELSLTKCGLVGTVIAAERRGRVAAHAASTTRACTAGIAPS